MNDDDLVMKPLTSISGEALASNIYRIDMTCLKKKTIILLLETKLHFVYVEHYLSEALRIQKDENNFCAFLHVGSGLYENNKKRMVSDLFVERV